MEVLKLQLHLQTDPNQQKCVFIQLLTQSTKPTLNPTDPSFAHFPLGATHLFGSSAGGVWRGIITIATGLH